MSLRTCRAVPVMNSTDSRTDAGSTASALAGDAQELPTAPVLPVVWRHIATYGPPVDLRTALASACACRASRLELQAMVTRGRLERPSQGLLESVCHAFPLLKELEVECGQCDTAAAAASRPRRQHGRRYGSYYGDQHDACSGSRVQQQQQQQQQGKEDTVTSPTDWGEDSESSPDYEDNDDCRGSTSEEHTEGTWSGRRGAGYSWFNEVVWRLDFEDMCFPIRAQPRRSPAAGGRRHAAFCETTNDSGTSNHQRNNFSSLTWPALERLHLRDASLITAHTRLPVHSAPRLRRLILQDSALSADNQGLCLPKGLRALHLHRVSVRTVALLNTVSGHPHLRTISATRIQCDIFDFESDLQLPCCEQLRLGFTGLTNLRIWAPCLRRLDLSACRNLRSLRLLQQEPQRYGYGNQAGGGLPAAMGALALAPAPGAPGAAEAAAGPALALSAPRQAAAGSSSSSSAPSAQQPPAVWVDLSGTDVSRYTLKQLRTHPRVGPERLVPPRWYGTGRSSSIHADEYDSDGRLGHGGDHGSSGEDEDHADDFHVPFETLLEYPYW